MAGLKSLTLESGSIAFLKEVESQPATSQTTGNVTINNAAVEGLPAHYAASFFLNSSFEQDGIEIQNMFHWNCVVPEQSDHAQYRLIEDQAAKQIAPMLRALADQIEADLRSFDEQRAKAS